MTRKNTPRSPYRLFRCRLSRRTGLTPHMIRLTFTGDDLDQCGDTLLDQRIKVVLGPPESLDSIPDDEEWYAACRAAQPAVVTRTYTIAALRAEQRELDIDFVSHGTEGPASRFAVAAEIGTPVVIAAPDRTIAGHESSGVVWQPGPRRVLLVGDETALPAIANIVRTLPADASGDVLVEVPTAADAQELAEPEGVRLRWCPRRDQGPSSGSPGCAVIPALAQTLAAHRIGPSLDALDEPADPPDRILWDVAEQPGDQSDELADHRLRAWIAGEAGWVKQTRQMLAQAGIPRDRSSFMGYWKAGSAAVG